MGSTAHLLLGSLLLGLAVGIILCQSKAAAENAGLHSVT